MKTAERRRLTDRLQNQELKLSLKISLNDVDYRTLDNVVRLSLQRLSCDKKYEECF